MRQRPDTAAGFGVGKNCGAPREINFRPSQTKRLAAAPARECEEPCHSYCRRPDPFRLSPMQRNTQRTVFVIAQAPFASPIGEALHAMHRVVGAHTASHRIT